MKNNFNSNTLSSEKRVIQSIGSEVDKKKLEKFFLKKVKSNIFYAFKLSFLFLDKLNVYR